MRLKANNLARVLKSGRIAMGLSQNELGALLKTNGQVISNVERGANSLNLRHIIKIAKILDVPLEDFKRAMVQDYEDSVNNEIYVILDKGIGDIPRLNDTYLMRKRRGRSLMPQPRVYDNSMQGGSVEGLSRS